MPMTPEQLFSTLDAFGIAHLTTRHRPVYTVAEGEDIKRAIAGGHTKNLFLKDKKGQLWMICALGESKIDLNATAKHLGAGRFSFGAADLMQEVLGVRPGAVTVFALVNDSARRVRLVLDAALFDHGTVNFHPLTNEATTSISADGLRDFLHALGRVAFVVGFDGLGRPVGDGPEID